MEEIACHDSPPSPEDLKLSSPQTNKTPPSAKTDRAGAGSRKGSDSQAAAARQSRSALKAAKRIIPAMPNGLGIGKSFTARAVSGRTKKHSPNREPAL